MDEQRTIYVGNVTASVDETAMRSVFDTCGAVLTVRMAGKAGLATFFCFVEFAEARSAKIALAMNGLLVGDRNIRVSLAKSGASGDRQRPTRASVGYEQPPAYYAPQSAYPAQPFSAGYAPRYAGAPPGPAYAGYPAPAAYPIYGAQNPFDAPGSSRSAAVASYGGGSGRAQGGHHDASLVARTVFVEHWDPAYNEDATAAFFEGVGRVTAVRISVDAAAPDGKNRAWVEFESMHAARDALDYSGKEVGGDVIRVRPSKSAIHTNGLQRYGGRVLPTAALPEAAAAKAAAIAKAAVDRALQGGPESGSAIALSEDTPAGTPADKPADTAQAAAAAADEAAEGGARTQSAPAVQEVTESDGQAVVAPSNGDAVEVPATEELQAAEQVTGQKRAAFADDGMVPDAELSAKRLKTDELVPQV